MFIMSIIGAIVLWTQLVIGIVMSCGGENSKNKQYMPDLTIMVVMGGGILLFLVGLFIVENIL